MTMRPSARKSRRRATNAAGPYTRLTSAPITATTYADTSATGGEWDLSQLPFEGPGAFLAEETFAKELRDTFKSGDKP